MNFLVIFICKFFLKCVRFCSRLQLHGIQKPTLLWKMSLLFLLLFSVVFQLSKKHNLSTQIIFQSRAMINYSQLGANLCKKLPFLGRFKHMILPEKLSPGGTRTRRRSGAACCATFAQKQSYLDHCGRHKAFFRPHLSIKASTMVGISTAKCLKLWAFNMDQTLCEQHLVVAKTKATEQAEKPEKKQAKKRLRRWFSGCIIYGAVNGPQSQSWDWLKNASYIDDMFNQERHVGLRVSSWSFHFFCVCVPAVTGGYSVQTTGFILHLAYLKPFIFGNKLSFYGHLSSLQSQ